MSSSRSLCGGPPANVDGEVRIYLHPGRRYLTAIEVDRLRDQFRVDWSRCFPDPVRAERECEGRVGFLVEVAEPIGAGDLCREAGVYFADGLR